MIRSFLLVLLIATTWTSAVQALDTAKVQAQLAKALGDARVENIQPSSLPGIYSVKLNGKLVYVSSDGRYLLQGSLFDLQTGSNLTTLSVMESIEDSSTIVFSPKEVKHTVTIFTDTSCGYCRKLHQEVPKLNANGIKVRYLLYPRAGPQSNVAAILQSIWCSDNQQEAMTTAKAGGTVPSKQCDNPINKHIELAQQLGLRGTPMLITDNGTVIPGYKPADMLISDLNASKENKF